MSEEEKKTIEDCKELIQELKQHKDKDFIGRLYYKNKPVEDILSVLLNLIEKQQKELNTLKEIEQSHQEENGKLRVELEQEKEKNKELKSSIDYLQKIEPKKLKIIADSWNEKVMTNWEKEWICKDKIKAIVDEHIPKQPNIITGEIEYTPNTNANSFLVQDILKLLEMN